MSCSIISSRELVNKVLPAQRSSPLPYILNGSYRCTVKLSNIRCIECRFRCMRKINGWSQAHLSVILTEKETELRSTSHGRLTRNSILAPFCFGSTTATQQASVPEDSRLGVSSPPVNWLAVAAFLSVVFFSLWFAGKSESRTSLGPAGHTDADPLNLSPGLTSPDHDEGYERFMSAVMQNRMVEKAVAALQRNDVIRCVVEMEQALEENCKSRESIDMDFYDSEEILEIYRAIMRVWLDGYPPDYGRLLQLRTMLKIPNSVAERLEEDISSKSDSFVI